MGREAMHTELYPKTFLENDHSEDEEGDGKTISCIFGK
jgi:hypothetical protein